jgi:Superinfection immunity protein
MRTFILYAWVWPAVLVLYFLPLLVGRARRVEGLGLIALINFVAGWTGLGWIVAMGLALRAIRPASNVQVTQATVLSQPGPPGWAGHPTGWVGEPPGWAGPAAVWTGPPPGWGGPPPPTLPPQPADGDDPGQQ